MAAALDFSKFTFTAEQIRSLSDLLYDDVMRSPEINSIFTIYPGIVYDKEVGYIGEGGLVGVAYQGCNPTPQGFTIATRKLTWTPKAWEVYLEECREDLEGTMAVYSLRYGVAAHDFSAGDYVNILVEVLKPSIRDFIVRSAWFGDTDAERQSEGGRLLDTVEPKYFNLIDGIFKQMSIQQTKSQNQRVNFTGVSKANIQEKLSELIYSAPMLLRQASDSFILLPQAIYDMYQQSLTGLTLDVLYRNMVEGQQTLTFNGIPVIAMPQWDKVLHSYYVREGAEEISALYTSRNVLALGVDDESTFSEVDVDYDKKNRKVLINAAGRLDAKLVNPEMFIYGSRTLS